jgi:predicted phosphoribosyltransferase
MLKRPKILFLHLTIKVAISQIGFYLMNFSIPAYSLIYLVNILIFNKVNLKQFTPPYIWRIMLVNCEKPTDFNLFFYSFMDHIAKFPNRTEAGKLLAQALSKYRGKENTIVLALPRGGVPVAHEIAKTLALPLDLLIVRKLGAPSNDELAIGAVSLGNTKYINRALIDLIGVPDDYLERVIKKEEAELERRNMLYRQSRAPALLSARNIILVDDGIATGATMTAAIMVLKKARAARVIAVSPVGAPGTIKNLAKIADEVICLYSPQNFESVGQYYGDFPQTSDKEVLAIMNSYQ